MDTKEMSITHLSNSFNFCLRKLSKDLDEDSFDFYYDRLDSVVKELNHRGTMHVVPKWVKDKQEKIEQQESVQYHVSYSEKSWY